MKLDNLAATHSNSCTLTFVGEAASRCSTGLQEYKKMVIFSVVIVNLVLDLDRNRSITARSSRKSRLGMARNLLDSVVPKFVALSRRRHGLKSLFQTNVVSFSTRKSQQLSFAGKFWHPDDNRRMSVSYVHNDGEKCPLSSRCPP